MAWEVLDGTKAQPAPKLVGQIMDFVKRIVLNSENAEQSIPELFAAVVGPALQVGFPATRHTIWGLAQ